MRDQFILRTQSTYGASGRLQRARALADCQKRNGGTLTPRAPGGESRVPASRRRLRSHDAGRMCLSLEPAPLQRPHHLAGLTLPQIRRGTTRPLPPAPHSSTRTPQSATARRLPESAHGRPWRRLRDGVAVKRTCDVGVGAFRAARPSLCPVLGARSRRLRRVFRFTPFWRGGVRSIRGVS